MNAFGWRGTENASANGAFDVAGATFPAEMIGDTVTSEGIVFKIGPHTKGTAANNAVRCEGQTIALPAGNFNCVYLLAAATDGDEIGTFAFGITHTTFGVQNWIGFIGSWDNRVFEGKVPELTYSVDNPLSRIDAGFIKRDPVAWYCDHHYTKGGKDAIYSYCYLFKYALDVPDGAKTVTLPHNPNIRVFAMTVALDPAVGTFSACPLYDDFAARTPIVIPAGWANSN